MALKHPRYCHRRITALLKRLGWMMNRKRVLRIWRQQALKVPVRQTMKSRLWLEGGRSVRLETERFDNVWCYDIAFECTED